MAAGLGLKRMLSRAANKNALGQGVNLSCKNCGGDVFEHEYFCVCCTLTVNAPNVRIVSSKKERSALLRRARAGRRSAMTAGAEGELKRLGDIVDAAPIAFNRQLKQLYQWFSRHDKYFQSWTAQADEGRRIIPDIFNIGRFAFEHNVNPNYSKQINFAYVDVGQCNLKNYGPFKVIFRRDAVHLRTTFLETNAYYFCEVHKVLNPSLMPSGYRSSWKGRRSLAEAKLGAKVRRGMADDDLKHLLLHDDDEHGPADFLEAHIFNHLHVSAVETVFGPPPSAEEAPMWSFVQSELRSFGANLEVRA